MIVSVEGGTAAGILGGMKISVSSVEVTVSTMGSGGGDASCVHAESQRLRAAIAKTEFRFANSLTSALLGTRRGV